MAYAVERAWKNQEVFRAALSEALSWFDGTAEVTALDYDEGYGFAGNRTMATVHVSMNDFPVIFEYPVHFAPYFSQHSIARGIARALRDSLVTS